MVIMLAIRGKQTRLEEILDLLNKHPLPHLFRPPLLARVLEKTYWRLMWGNKSVKPDTVDYVERGDEKMLTIYLEHDHVPTRWMKAFSKHYVDMDVGMAWNSISPSESGMSRIRRVRKQDGSIVTILDTIRLPQSDNNIFLRITQNIFQEW